MTEEVKEPVVAPLEEHPNIVAKNEVDKAALAAEQANAALVDITVAGTHTISTSLLHSTSRYVEFNERGVKRIEQII